MVRASSDPFLDESTLDESVIQSYSIEVSGVDKNTSAETVRMYFENEKRSKGGPTDNVWYNVKNGNYVVTFISSESEKFIVISQPSDIAYVKVRPTPLLSELLHTTHVSYQLVIQRGY